MHYFSAQCLVAVTLYIQARENGQCLWNECYRLEADQLACAPATACAVALSAEACCRD